MAQVVEILPHGRPEVIYPSVNNLVADGMAMQRVRASAALLLTYLSLNILSSAPEELSQ